MGWTNPDLDRKEGVDLARQMNQACLPEILSVILKGLVSGRIALDPCIWEFLSRFTSCAADSLSRSRSYLERASPFGLRAGFSSPRSSLPPGIAGRGGWWQPVWLNCP